MRIFLSYPSELKSHAEPIAFSLRSRGHKVFLDKDDLPPGRSYDDQIHKAILHSDVLVYLISPASVERGRYTLTELEFARRAWTHPADRVLPVMIEDTNLAKVPSFLKGVTILEPQGNVTAEVAAAVEGMRLHRGAFQYAKIGAVWAVLIVIAAFAARHLFDLLFSGPDFMARNDLRLALWIGVPVSALMFALCKKPSWLYLAPIATMVLAMKIGTSSVVPHNFFEPISIADFDWQKSETKASDEVDQDVDEKKKKLIEAIESKNQIIYAANGLLHFAFFGLVMAMGMIVGVLIGQPAFLGTREMVGFFATVAIAGACALPVGLTFYGSTGSIFYGEIAGALVLFVSAGTALGFFAARLGLARQNERAQI